MMSTIDILPDKVAEASFVISELLFDEDFEETKFRTERKIIQHELAEASDDPTIKVEELLLKTLFKNHPVRRPIGGCPKTVKKLTLDQLSNAHKTNYVPQNMILILTGNFTRKTSQTVLKCFEGRIGKETFSRKTNPIEAAKPETLVVEKKPGIAQTYLTIGASTVCSSHKDTPALDLISAILGCGTNSRLFIEMREKNALTYDANADHNKGVDFGYFSINCAVKMNNSVKARKLIFKEISKLRGQKVAANELERNKNLIIAEILRGIDNPQQSSEILAYMEIQFKSEKALVDYIGDLKAVSSENIMEVANMYLQEDYLTTVLLTPEK